MRQRPSTSGDQRKVMLATNTTWNVVNFRRGLLRELKLRGYEIVVVSPTDRYVSQLERLGCRHVQINIDNKGTNLIRDVVLVAEYVRVIIKERPQVFLGWTVKPNVYGSIAARLVGVPAINNVSGLGTVFIRKSWLTPLVKMLYKASLGASCRVFFQNNDDKEEFVCSRLVRPDQASVVPGSGVDLVRFAPSRKYRGTGGEQVTFILVARLVWDKGVGEFVEAARKVRSILPNVRFQILGFLDVENRTAVSRHTVQEWSDQGVIEYLGQVDDVRPYLAAADCVVLPSYREGTPRSLLEAAAMARPLIASDVPGCRDIVVNGVNGWLCNSRDVESLAESMLRMARAPESARREMGRQSRLKVEREYSETVVVQAYLRAIQAALGRSNADH